MRFIRALRRVDAIARARVAVRRRAPFPRGSVSFGVGYNTERASRKRIVAIDRSIVARAASAAGESATRDASKRDARRATRRRATRDRRRETGGARPAARDRRRARPTVRLPRDDANRRRRRRRRERGARRARARVDDRGLVERRALGMGRGDADARWERAGASRDERRGGVSRARVGDGRGRGGRRVDGGGDVCGD